MSAPETAPAVAPVDEVKAVETPAAEAAPVVAEAPKVEEATPVCFGSFPSYVFDAYILCRSLPRKRSRPRYVSLIHCCLVTQLVCRRRPRLRRQRRPLLLLRLRLPLPLLLRRPRLPPALLPPPRHPRMKPSPYVASPALLSRDSSSVQAEADAEAKKEDRPKSPGLLAKLLAPFKNEKAKVEKKVKAPKSPKKEKKKEGSEVRSCLLCSCLLLTCI